jgi:hypothetical protein
LKFKKLLATVGSEDITWNEMLVPCWRIDVGEPGQAPNTRIWVRKSDSLVLQHEASHAGKKLVMIRTVEK